MVAVREARNLTQAAMARMIGESAQRWGMYERGQRYPQPQLLAKFWQLTGATSDYVLFGRSYGLPQDLAELLRQADADTKKAG